ncbi:unnamed protein product [Lactuca saligna]|uniref:Uncharacterized protein n=1 Tax=Lactuca saligna TaxID=75948 RepID=A0AA35ZSE9_LACSI|nr:unnamed protein product [Lactuca saligna]
MKALGPNTFRLMKKSRKAAKVSYQGLKELVKFGNFVEFENTPTASSINVEVVEEHVAPKPKFQFAFEEVETYDGDEEEEVQERDMIENEFEDFVQSISIPKEDVADSEEPPQAVLVTTEPPSESDQEDSAYVLLPRKRKRILKALLLNKKPYLQKGLKLLEAHLKPPELDISKGKRKLPKFEFIDVGLLHNRVFDLEQSSAEKDLIIGKQDIRIREKIYDSSSGPVNPTSQSISETFVRPAPDANFDTFLSSDRASAHERRDMQIRVEQLRGKMLVMKHLDQNAPGDHPEMFFRQNGKKFTDKYGDHSGILM